MTYRVLDKDTLGEYLVSIKSVADYFNGETDFDITEVGDGNLNYVFKVRSIADPTKAVVLKQAVPYLRMVGEAWPLSRDRMSFEIRAQKMYNKLVPQLVPKVFHSDEEMSVLVMQCLDNHIILRLGMIDGIVYPKAAQDMGYFLAETLFKTSSFAMDSIERRKLMSEFVLNTELCKLTEEFIFTFPYMQHDSNYSNPPTNEWAKENICADSEYKLGVLGLKNRFITKTDALLHGDFHSGSLMVNTDESYVIDMEFAFFGPIGFDVGKILANFFLCHTAHYAINGGNAEYQAWLLDEAFTILSVFEKRFRELWEAQEESAMLTAGLLNETELKTYRDAVMLEILQDTIGYAGCSMARRTLGIAGVADIRDIEDTQVRSALEVCNLKLSKALISAHKSINDKDQFASLVRSFFADCSFEFQKS